jgi:hypothetical protein
MSCCEDVLAVIRREAGNCDLCSDTPVVICIACLGQNREDVEREESELLMFKAKANNISSSSLQIPSLSIRPRRQRHL